ncbi:MAG: carbon storage regulator [Deltaproteobacteria bacterium]
MLVLTRKIGERIIIGEKVDITVVQIRGSKVRLGVTAPRQVPVVRAELGTRTRESRAGQLGSAGGRRELGGRQVGSGHEIPGQRR